MNSIETDVEGVEYWTLGSWTCFHFLSYRSINGLRLAIPPQVAQITVSTTPCLRYWTYADTITTQLVLKNRHPMTHTTQ